MQRHDHSFPLVLWKCSKSYQTWLSASKKTWRVKRVLIFVKYSFSHRWLWGVSAARGGERAQDPSEEVPRIRTQVRYVRFGKRIWQQQQNGAENAYFDATFGESYIWQRVNKISLRVPVSLVFTVLVLSVLMLSISTGTSANAASRCSASPSRTARATGSGAERNPSAPVSQPSEPDHWFTSEWMNDTQSIDACSHHVVPVHKTGTRRSRRQCDPYLVATRKVISWQPWVRFELPSNAWDPEWPQPPTQRHRAAQCFGQEKIDPCWCFWPTVVGQVCHMGTP